MVDGLEGHIKRLGGAFVSLGAASRRAMARAMPTAKTGAGAVRAAQEAKERKEGPNYGRIFYMYPDCNVRSFGPIF